MTPTPQALEGRYAEEQRGGAVSLRCQFEYAWGLGRSPYGRDVARGVALLQGGVGQGGGAWGQGVVLLQGLGREQGGVWAGGAPGTAGADLGPRVNPPVSPHAPLMFPLCVPMYPNVPPQCPLPTVSPQS